MAGGNKKKKKPVANPARGFATTSIASKPKPELEPAVEPASTDVSSVATPADSILASETGADTLPSDASGSNAPRELHELSPEELEAQLEASELQNYLERYSAKVKKETNRQVSRLQTEKRLLRGQADFLSVKDWLPEELMQHILELTLSDLQHETHVQKRSSFSTGDESLAKVWQLRQCLLDLLIPLARTNEVLAWLVANPPASPISSTVWGLDECLDWLALHCEASELDDYDVHKVKSGLDFLVEDENDLETLPAAIESHAMPMQELPETDNDKENTSSPEAQIIEVSDIESDLEPEEMLSTYLRTKASLFELTSSTEAGPPARGRAAKGPHSKSQTKAKSAGEKKLEAKLRKIESDVLFDQREADYHWATKKVELARAAAERRKLQLHRDEDPDTGDSAVPTSEEANVSNEAERPGQELLLESENHDGDDMLNGIFDALPGVEQTADAGNSTDRAHVTIRDFGKLTGMSAKRVLEEACRARDARCKLSYTLISPTTYSSRHAVTVQWTIKQEPLHHSYLPDVTVKQKATTVDISMTNVATPGVAQSEAYVATIALFLIFSGSPKEEKAHLRLPSTFRNLWDELTKLKTNDLYEQDSAIIKEIRELIDKNRSIDHEDDEEEVVFNANSRWKLGGVSGTASPAQRPGTPAQGMPDVSEGLRRMWQRKSDAPAYQRMLTGRMNLPMYHFRSDALNTIQHHQVTILCGETGCGKSTQLPAFILENELANGRQCKIYCTEPRRISAISLAQRVSEEMGENKGDVGTARSLVGYAIRLESQTVAQTRLIYATVGIVLRMLENANGLDDITHLCIDEVHERSIDTDFLLIILRSLMLRRPNLKVVLMSATVDAQRFSQYLNGAPIINVPGRTFPVQAKFLEDAIELTGHTNEDAASNAVDEDAVPEDGEKSSSSAQLQGYSKRTQKTLENYDEYLIDYSLIVKLVEKIAHDAKYQPFSKAILIFLPGIAEIRQLNDMLGGHPKFLKGWRVHPLHSSFSSEDQQAAFEVPPEGMRKIVLATNIAETGITIPDVTCVIDTGKHKEMRFDERRQMSRLIQSFIARANAKQRRGRAGRVQEGLCFHLFTKHRHDHLMVEQQTPEMLRLSLQDLVMRVKICKLGNIESALAEALDPPSSKNVRRAIDALVEVGALTSSEELTSLGTQLAKLPLDAQLGKLILLGSNLGCLDFALTAAATLSSKSPFLNPMHAKKQADTVRLGFKRSDSDLLTVYNAYCAWRKVCTTPHMPEYQFCNKNFLSPQNLGNIEDLKAQLLNSLIDAEFVHLGPEERQALSKMRHNHKHRNFVALPAKYTVADENDVLASSAVAWSFYPKLLKRDGNGWRNVANNQSLGLHPTSVNKSSSPQDVKYLSFYSIMQSSSRFTNAQETSAVSDFALVLMAGDAVFNMYAGVIIIDGNRLRLKIRDWRSMILIKRLRTKLKEVMGKLLRNPGKELSDRSKKWLAVVKQIFERQKPANPKPVLR